MKRLQVALVSGIAWLLATDLGRAGDPAAAAVWPTAAAIQEILARDTLAAGDTLRVSRLGEGAHTSAVLIQLAAGARVPGHVHREHDETVAVVRGRARMRAGERLATIQAGDVVLVPAGTPHGAIAGPEGCVVISLYAPRWDPADRHRDPLGDP